MVSNAGEKMDIIEGLACFIKNALPAAKRDRFLDFLGKEKNHKKFYSSLDHDFENHINKEKIVTKLTDSELTQAGSLYCSNGVTNNSEIAMIDLYNKAPWEGGWLLINKAGTYGVYRAEGRANDEIHIRL